MKSSLISYALILFIATFAVVGKNITTKMPVYGKLVMIDGTKTYISFINGEHVVGNKIDRFYRLVGKYNIYEVYNND